MGYGKYTILDQYLSISEMVQYSKYSLSVLIAVFQWTWVSWYQYVSILDFVGAKDDGVVVTTGAVRCAKL